jgi:hypothetical protein
VTAPAGFVDGLSEQLLAGAGLAEQQHRGIERGHPFDPARACCSGTLSPMMRLVAPAGRGSSDRTGGSGRGLNRTRHAPARRRRANPLEPHQPAPQDFAHQAEALDHRLPPVGVTLAGAHHQAVDHPLTQHDRHCQAPHDPTVRGLRAVAAGGVAQTGGGREGGHGVARQALNEPWHPGDVRVGAAGVRRKPP